MKNWQVHSYRYPLPRWGVTAMKFVYFSIPVVGGYGVMKWCESISEQKWGNIKGGDGKKRWGRDFDTSLKMAKDEKG